MEQLLPGFIDFCRSQGGQFPGYSGPCTERIMRVVSLMSSSQPDEQCRMLCGAGAGCSHQHDMQASTACLAIDHCQNEFAGT